jgi:hypothetical protein
MKTTAFKQPRPPAAVADEWVKGETPVEVAENAAEPSTPAVARLTVDLPAEVRDRFKAACALRRTRMVDEVRKMIDEWMQKYGKL